MQWFHLGGQTHFADENVRVYRSETKLLRADQMLCLYWPTMPISVVRSHMRLVLRSTLRGMMANRHHHRALSKGDTRKLRYLLNCPTRPVHMLNETEREFSSALAHSNISTAWVRHVNFLPTSVPSKFEDGRKYFLRVATEKPPFGLLAQMDNWHLVSQHNYDARWTAQVTAMKIDDKRECWLEFWFDDIVDRDLAHLTSSGRRFCFPGDDADCAAPLFR